MHMQEVKPVVFSHFRHPRGQRQVVGRKLEQRIVRDRNLVIKNALVPPVQPERLRIGDEVYLVSQRRQLNSQLRSHHPGAAVGGVACDSNAHNSFLKKRVI